MCVCACACVCGCGCVGVWGACVIVCVCECEERKTSWGMPDSAYIVVSGLPLSLSLPLSLLDVINVTSSRATRSRGKATGSLRGCGNVSGSALQYL